VGFIVYFKLALKKTVWVCLDCFLCNKPI